MVVVEAAKPIIPVKVAVVKTVKATKPIIPIKVTVVETVEAECGVSHWVTAHRHPRHRTWHESAAHSHPGHRITVPSHLRRRSRDRENAW